MSRGATVFISLIKELSSLNILGLFYQKWKRIVKENTDHCTKNEVFNLFLQ